MFAEKIERQIAHVETVLRTNPHAVYGIPERGIPGYR